MTIEFIEIKNAASFDEDHVNKLKSVLGEQRFNPIKNKISFSLSNDLEKIKVNFSNNNIENIILALHSMKGATASIGLNNLHVVIKTMEESLRQTKNLKQLDDFIPWIEAVIKEISPS